MVQNSDRYIHPLQDHKLRSGWIIASILFFIVAFHLPAYGKYGERSWTFLENDGEGVWFYYHDHKCSTPSFRIAQTKIIYNQDGVLKHVEKYGEGYSNLHQAISVWEIACSQRKFRLLSATFYAKDQAIIEDYDDEEEKYFAFQDIPAGSYLDLLSRIICR